MKTIFLILFILVLTPLIGQNHTDTSGLKQGIWIINYTCDSSFDGLNTLRIYSYVNDTLHGNYLVYSNNYKLLYQTTYSKGKVFGAEIYYTHNGKLLRTQVHPSDSTYVLTDFFGRGRPYKIATYTLNNELHGSATNYRRSGRIKSLTYYENDIQMGSTLYFRRNGRLKLK